MWKFLFYISCGNMLILSIIPDFAYSSSITYFLLVLILFLILDKLFTYSLLSFSSTGLVASDKPIFEKTLFLLTIYLGNLANPSFS